MKYLFILFFLTLFAPLNSEQEIVKIPHKDSFDSYWKLSEENIQESESMQEWIPSCESEETWTKSFGVQCYRLPEDYDIHYFYRMFIETLGKDFEENKNNLEHEVLKEDSNHILFSWWCADLDYEIGREWVHILKDKDHKILFVRFATKDHAMNTEDQVWVKCLEGADFFTPNQEE